MPWKCIHCLINHYAVKTLSGGMAPCILHLSTRWKWVVSFTAVARAPRTYWIGGWLGLRASLDVGKRKKSHHGPCLELNRGLPAHSLVSIWWLSYPHSIVLPFHGQNTTLHKYYQQQGWSSTKQMYHFARRHVFPSDGMWYMCNSIRKVLKTRATGQGT